MVCKYLAEEIVSRCSSWPCCRGGNTIFWILSLGVDLIQSSIEGEHTSGLEVMEVSAAAPVPEGGRVGGMWWKEGFGCYSAPATCRLAKNC